MRIYCHWTDEDVTDPEAAAAFYREVDADIEEGMLYVEIPDLANGEGFIMVIELDKVPRVDPRDWVLSEKAKRLLAEEIEPDA